MKYFALIFYIVDRFCILHIFSEKAHDTQYDHVSLLRFNIINIQW